MRSKEKSFSWKLKKVEMIKQKKIPEILAPCGSYDILVAAVKAGANACYIGGNQFGARAYAENFSEEAIRKAIDFSHLHGTKLYLTVNTLIKDNEIEELYRYLASFYEAGLDAVIVQDLGAFAMIRNNFPGLSLHCSTQMNITSIHGAEYMKKEGASRIVTAREMSLDEIREIKEKVDIEIETFVHGAMCYSYSGQCLMSSLAGGRSGNRGRCAQPCRKCYDGEYILSMKDLCSLENIPALIEAGIDSFKIEGRMKNIYYVASTVAAYRELAEDFCRGDFSIEKAMKLKYKLANIYNRGGFCGGYFFPEKRDEMISKERPNNQGVKVGDLVGIGNGQIAVKLTEELYENDVLELVLRDESTIDITTGKGGKKGETVSLNAPKTRLLQEGQEIYRTRCNHLLEEIDKQLPSKGYLGLNGAFQAKIGEPMKFNVKRQISEKVYEADAEGPVVEESKNRPAEKEQIKGKLSQLGDTPYYFDELTIEMADNAFLSIGAVKELRRKTIEKLEEKITESFRRKTIMDESERIQAGYDVSLHGHEIEKMIENSGESKRETSNDSPKKGIPLRVEVSDERQLSQLLDCRDLSVSALYMDHDLYEKASENGQMKMIVERGIKIYLMLPYIIHNFFDLSKYLPKDRIDGIYIRNLDEFALMMEYHKENDQKFNLVFASSLYAYNRVARSFFCKIGGAVTFEIPKELNLKEIVRICNNIDGTQNETAYCIHGKYECETCIRESNEFTIYEYQQVMLSAQCVRKNHIGCGKKSEVHKITDDLGNSFYAKTVCGECCNVIYNGVAFLADEPRFLDEIKPDFLKAAFHFENENETAEVLQKLIALQKKDTLRIQKNDKTRTTTGHLLRGVI